ncbi:hypothetical protein D9V37_09240 [Nocardioides mangrovicus]|uniref:Uncharacterized protein n=1 Tax=Nocardioides mangrovicus TaxID=2478913 RepID=A0A3L8P5U8_9ACTN|nr:DUF6350 family protein [Nocardioides mangrovicus]RLV50039.1 hypothetical protein D9V37_09240 [Nocardioides mangrovicus]
MTELLSRPRVGARAATTAAAPVTRPLTVSATLAGFGSALGGLAVFLAVAVTGWFLADAGAHGDTTDALRVGADAWLVGHGSHLSFGGTDYTLVPLGLTALLAWAAFRGGRWAGRVSPPGRDRDLVHGVGLFCCGYVVVTVATSVLAATAEIRGELVLTLVGAVLVAGIGGGCGVLTGADAWPAAARTLPAGVRPVVRAALAAWAGVMAAAALLVTAMLVVGLGSSASLVSRLGLHGGDAVMLVTVTALLAPNAVALGGAYLLGPGFAVGTGTTVSPAVVVLGPVPSFPLLSGLPDTGATPWWTTALMASPAVVAALAVVLVQRRHPVLGWRDALLRGLAAGVAAGVLTGVAAALGGGAVGTGRMAEVGTPLLPVLGAGAMAMGLGGVVGAVVATVLQRRGLLRVEPDLAEEPTVEIVRQYRTDRPPPPPASQREREATDLLQRLVRQADDDEDTIRLI